MGSSLEASEELPPTESGEPRPDSLLRDAAVSLAEDRVAAKSEGLLLVRLEVDLASISGTEDTSLFL